MVKKKSHNRAHKTNAANLEALEPNILIIIIKAPNVCKQTQSPTDVVKFIGVFSLKNQKCVYARMRLHTCTHGHTQCRHPRQEARGHMFCCSVRASTAELLWRGRSASGGPTRGACSRATCSRRRPNSDNNDNDDSTRRRRRRRRRRQQR